MGTAQEQKSDENKPKYVTDLEAAYGAPSQAGFGSAVFYEPICGRRRPGESGAGEVQVLHRRAVGALGRGRLDGAVEGGLCAPDRRQS